MNPAAAFKNPAEAFKNSTAAAFKNSAAAAFKTPAEAFKNSAAAFMKSSKFPNKKSEAQKNMMMSMLSEPMKGYYALCLINVLIYVLSKVVCLNNV